MIEFLKVINIMFYELLKEEMKMVGYKGETRLLFILFFI